MFVFTVDLGISVKEDSAATSSPRTAESSAVAGANGKNLGTQANAEAPAVKSRFFLTLSRPVPGRAGDRAAGSSAARGELDASSGEGPGNKGPSDRAALPPAAAQGLDPDKTPGQTPARPAGFSAAGGPAPLPPESGGAAPAEPKDASFLDKLFKLDKAREKAPAASPQEAKRGDQQHQQGPADHAPGVPGPSHNVPAERVSAGEGQSVSPLTRAQGGRRGEDKGKQVAGSTVTAYHLPPLGAPGRNICLQNNPSCGICFP